MAPRYQILEATIPDGAISAFDKLSRADYLEPIIVPRFAEAFKRWLDEVALATALSYPVRSGKGQNELYQSARVRYSKTLDSIRGYFLVSGALVANEFGANIVPQNASMIAIPMKDALRPDGSPKRRGPMQWKPLKTFIYKSKKNGHLYIAYKTKERGLILLYLLVDKAKIIGKHRLKNSYDAALPALYAQWSGILQDAISEVYSDAFNDAMRKKGLDVPRRPGNGPNAGKYAQLMMPRYT